MLRIRTRVWRFIHNYKGIAVTVILIAAVAMLFIYAANGASDAADSSALEVLERAIVRAAVQCYAIEGFFPPTLEYLTENYGLIVDTRKFFVTYETFGHNVFPVINIFHVR
jgi:hypothetical protein